MKQLLLIIFGLFTSPPGVYQDYHDLRNDMVRAQIERRGISHQSTLKAMRKVERHLFVPAEYRKYAYEDTALPIS